ncbi:amino acid adenylation domain-containing protein [Photorhabdus viridis]|uniref:amino acid adenylation domain-containing protein n=1 Tax=Photorhabdus viridis TaxID=3163327 RepID=UPI0033072D05
MNSQETIQKKTVQLSAPQQAVQLLLQLEQQQAKFWLEGDALKFRAPEGVMNPHVIAQLKNLKPQIVALIQEWQEPQSFVINPAQKHLPFALSDVQSAYFVGRHAMFDYGGVGCHGYFEILTEHWDVKRLEQVWNQLIQRHDMLRAVFTVQGQQQILPEVDRFTIDCDSSSQEELRQTLSHRVYQTDCWPLFDLKVSQAAGKSCLHFSIDLLIADFLSVQILLAELLKGYQEPQTELAPLQASFRDVMEFERRRHHQRSYASAREYWLKRLPELPASPQLPHLPVQSGVVPRFSRYDLQLTIKQWEQLQQHCRLQGVSPSALLLALFSETLVRWSETKSFCLNLTVMNRRDLHEDIHRMVGDFTSVSLLQADISQPLSLLERVKNLQAQLWQDLEHNAFSGIEVMRELARQRGAEAARMPIVFTSALVGEGKEQAQDIISQLPMDIEIGYGISQTPQVWIDCQVMARNGGLLVNWDIMEGVFPLDLIRDMFNCFTGAIHQVLEHVDVWDQVLVINLPEYQQKIRQQVNATEEVIKSALLHQGILEQAGKTPDALALIDACGQVTYQQMVTRATKLAAFLPQGGHSAVLMEKGAEQVITTLAILIAGGVYLPLDISQPLPRILQILTDAQVSAVLTDNEVLAQQLREQGFNAASTENLSELATTSVVSVKQNDPHNLAYIIYTSGSTGQPKGVMISHDAALNTISDINRRMNVTSTDRMLALARLSFDLSVYDIFGVLSAGGALILPQEQDLQNPAQWARLIDKHQVTLWNSVPAQMTMLTRYLSEGGKESIGSLRCVMMSGDWIPLNLPTAIYQHAPDAYQFSLGGATEAAIWSNIWPIEPSKTYHNSIPYGTPLANQQFRILDLRGEPCPDWVAGELWIGGRGVAQGYWQDEEKTRHHFITDSQGQRWYRTGDRGRYTINGIIEFLGRCDNQVKIRGYRVETGEIEAVLERHNSVAQAAVVVKGDKHNQELHAFVEAATENSLERAEKLYQRYEMALQKVRSVASNIEATIDKQKVEKLVWFLDRVALLHMAGALVDVGALQAGKPATLDSVMENGSIAAENRQLTRRWLRALVQHQLIQQQGEYYQLNADVSEYEIKQCWQQCYDLMSALDDDQGLLTYLERSSQCLPELLQGKEDPLNLLFPDGKLDVATKTYQNNLISKMMNRLLLAAAEQKAAQINHEEGRCLRVLEIGAGVGGTSNVLIPKLAGWKVEYTFTDVSPFFLNEAKLRYQQFDFIRYRLFDFNRTPVEQGLDCGQFDMIVSSNVLHNAVIARQGLEHLRQLLAPDGWLLVIEATRDNYQLMTSMEFKHGLSDFADERLELDSPFMPQKNWLNAMNDVGAETLWAYPPAEDALYQLGQSFILAQFNLNRKPCSSTELLASLKQQLPAYMVPARLTVLDRLPVTANGKVDRKGMPDLPEHSGNEPVAESNSSDELEQTLLTLCRELLGHNNIGLDDDFFASGGDSLLITQWVSRIRQELGENNVPWEGSLRQVLQQPTVRALAAFLRTQSVQDKRASDNHACLTLLKEGHGDPVVILHEGSGTVLPCLPLTEKLSGPVYALSVVDTEAFLQIPSEQLISQLARHYLRDIQSLPGRCHLFGYCMGGLLAFEMARQAMENQTPVASVTIASSYQIPYLIDDPLMIDMAIIWGLSVECPWPLPQEQLETVYEALLAEKPEVIDRHSVAEYARARGMDAFADAYMAVVDIPEDQRLQQLVSAIRKNEIAEKELIRMCSVFRHSIRGVCRYQPDYFAGDLTFACQNSDTYLLPALQQDMKEFWQQYCLGNVNYLSLNGDHFDCIKSDNVMPLVNHLEQNKAQVS